jgi:ATP-binding cassette subfamily B protein
MNSPAEPAFAPAPSTHPSVASLKKSAETPISQDEDEDEGEDDEDDEDDGLVRFTGREALHALAAVARFIRPFLKAHRRGLLMILIGLSVETLFNVIMPLSIKFLIDDVLEREGATLLMIVAAVLGVSGLAVSMTAIWYEWIHARVAAAVLADIRRTLFAKVLALPAAYMTRHRGGEITSRFSNDLASVEEVLTGAGSWGLLPLFELIAGLILLFVLSWKLALVALLVFPLTVLGPRFITPRAIEASYRVRQAQAQGMGVVQERTAAYRTARAFGLGAISRRIFGRRNRAIRLAGAQSNFLNAMVERSVTIAVLLLHLVLFIMGAWLAFNEVISIGTFVTFENVFWELSYNIGHLTSFMPVLIAAAGSVRHIAELTDLAEAPAPARIAGDLPRPTHSLNFESVSFGYDEPRGVLKDLNLAIPIGRNVAIVGPSGAGKSTIVQLLLRLYEPGAGRVLLDGRNIADYVADAIRRHIGAVFQDSDLFNATIAENISYGRLDATQDEIEDAARDAEIHDAIMRMPEGYATMAGEHGDALSGGERQRIALARAILRDPAILLLDEATSALDQGTEAAIMQTVQTVAEGRTLIFITHRLSAITDFDEIIVMSGGKAVQHGAHADLVASPGVYRDLWERHATRRKAKPKK